jgi:hypothetical protein
VTNGNKTKNENFNCNDLVKYTQRNTLALQMPFIKYGHFVLEWLREWSKDTRNKVLIDGLIANEGIIKILKIKYFKILTNLFKIILNN